MDLYLYNCNNNGISLKIYQQCVASGLNYQWQEVNAVHAFMRDEGERYDGALALQMYQQAVQFFQRTLLS